MLFLFFYWLNLEFLFGWNFLFCFIGLIFISLAEFLFLCLLINWIKILWFFLTSGTFNNTFSFILWFLFKIYFLILQLYCRIFFLFILFFIYRLFIFFFLRILQSFFWHNAFLNDWVFSIRTFFRENFWRLNFLFLTDLRLLFLVMRIFFALFLWELFFNGWLFGW